MSVPKSERRQSNVEYIIILQQLEIFFINKNKGKTKVPMLSEELVKLSMEAYNYGTRYFELCNGRIMGTTADKKKFCKLTYWTARELASQINILVAIRMADNKPVKELLIKTQDILKCCNLLKEQLTQLNKEQ